MIEKYATVKYYYFLLKLLYGKEAHRKGIIGKLKKKILNVDKSIENMRP